MKNKVTMEQQGKLEEFTNDLMRNPAINYLVYRWVPGRTSRSPKEEVLQIYA